MRTVSAFIVSLVAIAAPAIANQCYWSNGHIYCNAGCKVVDRWWEGSREWMSYSCIPPFLTDPGFILAAIVFAVIVVVAVAGVASTASLRQETAEAEAQTIEAQEIADKLKAAAAEADRFIETYRK